MYTVRQAGRQADNNVFYVSEWLQSSNPMILYEGAWPGTLWLADWLYSPSVCEVLAPASGSHCPV